MSSLEHEWVSDERPHHGALASGAIPAKGHRKRHRPVSGWNSNSQAPDLKDNVLMSQQAVSSHRHPPGRILSLTPVRIFMRRGSSLEVDFRARAMPHVLQFSCDSEQVGHFSPK